MPVRRSTRSMRAAPKRPRRLSAEARQFLDDANNEIQEQWPGIYGRGDSYTLRFAVPGDFAATNIDEVQLQNQKICASGFLARRDEDGKMRVQPVTGIEAYHPDDRSAWARPGHSQGNSHLYRGGPLKKDTFGEDFQGKFWLKGDCRFGGAPGPGLDQGDNVVALFAVTSYGHLAFGDPQGSTRSNGELRLVHGPLGLNSQTVFDRVNGRSYITDGSKGQLAMLFAEPIDFELEDVRRQVSLLPNRHRLARRRDASKYGAAFASMDQAVSVGREAAKRLKQLHNDAVKNGKKGAEGCDHGATEAEATYASAVRRRAPKRKLASLKKDMEEKAELRTRCKNLKAEGGRGDHGATEAEANYSVAVLRDASESELASLKEDMEEKAELRARCLRNKGGDHGATDAEAIYASAVLRGAPKRKLESLKKDKEEKAELRARSRRNMGKGKEKKGYTNNGYKPGMARVGGPSKGYTTKGRDPDSRAQLLYKKGYKEPFLQPYDFHNAWTAIDAAHKKITNTTVCRRIMEAHRKLCICNN